MRRNTKRQAVLLGLAFFLVVTLARTAWTAREEVRTQAKLLVSARWLRGMTVVVDAGHGGPDPGAVVGGTREKDLVLQIAHKLKESLEQVGVKVVMTRSQDKDLGGSIREELGRRVALIDEHNAQLFISIHANKDGCYCWGAQTFYQRKGMPAGKELAIAIQTRLREMTPTTRVALPADYFVLRTSRVPASMVEVGFLSSAQELERLKDPDYQRVLVTAITIGMADFVRSSRPEGKAGGSIGR